MKVFKRALVSIIMLVSIVSSAACGDRDIGQHVIDTSKSQLYVGVHDGGYRMNWLETWGRKFEELHKETEFEEGKKGVEVIPSFGGYALDATTLSLTSQLNEIVFTEQANYYGFIRNNTAYDITDWVTTPLTEYGESKSISEKLSPWDREYFGQNSVVPQYYGVPWYSAFMSINYDIELFNDRGFFFAAEGHGDSDGFIIDEYTPKSLGPDGRTGVDAETGKDYSADDGTPATYDEFFKMCDKMVMDGVTPIIWAGSVQGYVTQLLDSLVADAEGYNKMSINYTFEGTVDNLIDTIENGIITYEKSTKIDEENGYLLQKQAGKYYGLKFLHRLITTKNDDGTPKYYNYNDSFSMSFSHKAAQTKFLQSKYRGSAIAMLIDGTWWYNEASDTFRAMSGTSGAGQKVRQLGILPIPKPDESFVGQESTLMSSWTTAVVVRKNISPSKIELAREFYRFIHTDENLSTFVSDANGIRPFDYELTEDARADSSPYALQQYTLYNNVNMVNPYSAHPIVRNYLSLLRGYNTVIEVNSYADVTTAFNEGYSAEDYFFGLSKYMRPDSWRTKFLTGTLD